jgi:hypothetical protein
MSNVGLSADETKELENLKTKFIKQVLKSAGAEKVGVLVVLVVMGVYAGITISNFRDANDDDEANVVFTHEVIWGKETPGVLSVALQWVLFLIVTAIVMNAVSKIYTLFSNNTVVIEKLARSASQATFSRQPSSVASTLLSGRGVI